MTTFITLISVALLAAMVTSSWGDLQESSPTRDIEAHHRGRRSPSPIDRQRLYDPYHPRGRRSPSPIDRQRLYDPYHPRGRRSPSPIVRPPAPPFRHPFHHHRLVRSAQPKISALEVTKGTYVCGDKICRMTPGEIPKNCPQGLCQYPLGPMDHLGHAAKQN